MEKLTTQSLDVHKAQVAVSTDYIKVGMSTCGIAAGAREVFDTLCAEAAKRKSTITIKKCGCLGMCYAEPLVEVACEGMPTVVYSRVTSEFALKIIDKHVIGKRLLNDSIVVR